MSIDWAYMRKGWTSCKKAWESLKQGKIDIKVEISAKKEPLANDKAWQTIEDADHIVIASGKKTLEFKPNPGNKDEIMKKILGRTGNLRAPTLRRGNIFYIGYNEDLYQQLTGS